MDELGASSYARVCARVDEDQQRLREEGSAGTLLGEWVLIDGRATRELTADVHRVDWVGDPDVEQNDRSAYLQDDRQPVGISPGLPNPQGSIGGTDSMRFDDLLLTEDEYPMAPYESKQEWLLMDFRGVPVRVIAAWCRVDVSAVRRVVTRHTTSSPRWFGRCLVLHDQPSPDRRRPISEGLWRKHYNDVAAHVTEHGRLPSQNHGDHARVLYRWIEAQRRQNDAGNLTQDRLEALDQLGAWQGVRRGRPNEHWTRRLSEVRRFYDDTGRLPMYDPAGRPAERLLAV
jgi:hypothetical protein